MALRAKNVLTLYHCDKNQSDDGGAYDDYFKNIKSQEW
jgi:hypothetical protein